MVCTCPRTAPQDPAAAALLPFLVIFVLTSAGGVPYLSLVGEDTALAGDLSHEDWSAARLVLGDRLLPGLNLAGGGLFARADIGRSQRRECTPRALGPQLLLDCASSRSPEALGA